MEMASRKLKDAGDDGKKWSLQNNRLPIYSPRNSVVSRDRVLNAIGHLETTRRGKALSDSDTGKKLVEEEDLRLFLEAYDYVTGDSLCVQPSERPDFIGWRSNGDAVGIEITAIVQDPANVYRKTIIPDEKHMEPSNVLNSSWAAIKEKDQKRAKVDWKHPDHTILVLRLNEARLRDIKWVFDPSLKYEYASFGFEEIWLADFCDFEAYGDIEIFGLYPSRWWGYHERFEPGRKPFG